MKEVNQDDELMPFDLDESDEDVKIPDFRWRIIPAVFIGIFSALILLGGIFYIGLLGYIWVAATPGSFSAEDQSGQLVPNLSNLITGAIRTLIGLVGLYASRWWWKQRYRIGCLASIVFWAGLGLMVALERNG